MADTTSLSVRGEARRSVEPDSATLTGTISAARPSKPDAVAETALLLASVVGDLRALGGVALTAAGQRLPLTWSARSVATHVERQFNPETGQSDPTGQVVATVGVVVAVRDFELLDRLGSILSHHEQFDVHYVGWEVDADNPAWPEVRAEAIAAALQKGRDYASALGGSIGQVEHVADAGLLSSIGTPQFGGFSGLAGSSGKAMRGGGDAEAPSLDPVPQELVAVIEARFIATGVSLDQP